MKVTRLFKFSVFSLVTTFLIASQAVASQDTQTTPTLEAVLQANNNAEQRFGIGNNTANVKCAIYADPTDSNYQYVLAGSVISPGKPGWYLPYGGPDGDFDIQFWSLNPQTNSLVFAYSGNSVTLTYNPNTLIITGYTSDFTGDGLGIDSCVLF